MLAGSHSSPAALEQLARQRLDGGDLDGAIAAYAECVRLAPHNPAAYNNLGVTLIRAGRFQPAIETLQSALVLQPASHRVRANLGKALREVGRMEEAIEQLRGALALQPDYAVALVNLGDALAATGELDAARRTLEQALQLAPSLIEARMALGMVLLQQGATSAALAELRTAVSLAPEHAEAHMNLGHALFVSGDWQSAWPHLEYRLVRPIHRARMRPPGGMSRWNGILEAGLTLWLAGEQGLGDHLQFVRYAAVLRAQGVRCVIACEPALVGLLRLADLAEQVVPTGTTSDAPEARWVPLLSLPAWHGTQPDSVPGPRSYLVADPARCAAWREALAGLRGLRVAIVWAGNPRMETGWHADRSPPLAALAPLFEVPGVCFISLQKGAGEEQLERASFRGALRRIPNLDDGPHAFLDTAAILKCVDLLITSDTSVAHLGGALGVETWLCLAHEPDWRWMRHGEATPWYSSMRLFRQSARGDWGGLYATVAQALARRVGV